MCSLGRLIAFGLLAQVAVRANANPTPNNSSHSTCRAIPGLPDWPSDSSWASLNSSLSGRLFKPIPPGAVCHPDQPTFNATLCPMVQAEWLTAVFHTDDPVSAVQQNWNNDTCLPQANVTCSGEGYPIYVINATCAEHIKIGVDYARRHNIRLIVKATGHDHNGRSSAPNSLSIWTHHMNGLSFHEGFAPKGCNFSIDTHAVTAAAGSQFGEMDLQASLRNLTIVAGNSETVGPGGYLTGGGHGALSATYGMGADQVLEMEIVTPRGEILTINECQNQDLFWAIRGGGGSTFGVITSATIKAFPATPFAAVTFLVGTNTTSDAYWSVIAYILSQYPSLSGQGIAGIPFILPSFTNVELNITTPVAAYAGYFFMPLLSPSNSSATLAAAITDVFNNATAPFPGQFKVIVLPKTYPDFYAWFKDTNGPLDGGSDALVGSWLLDEKALTGDLNSLKEAIKAFTPPDSYSGPYLVSGRNVWDSVPRGGSNSINPAWRKAYLHFTNSVSWEPLDPAGKAKQEDFLTNTYTKALRDLAPDMGAYVNEADPNTPNWPHAFWGDNYSRLLDIKRKVDPHDVFWCTPCVGNERWEEVGNMLCQV